MAESDEEVEEGPAVPLGEGDPVQGAPLSRLAARLTWPMEKSAIIERLGEEEIRTADGPISLGDVLGSVDDTYFGSRQHFTDAVRAQLPDGPVSTE